MTALPLALPTQPVLAWCMRHLPTPAYEQALAAYRIIIVPQLPRPRTVRQAWLDMALAVGGVPDVIVYMGVHRTWWPMAARCQEFGIQFVRTVTDERDEWTGSFRQGVLEAGRLVWQTWIPQEVM